MAETGKPNADEDPQTVTDDQVFEPDDPDLAVLDAAHEASQLGPPLLLAETTKVSPVSEPDSARGGDQAPEATAGHDRDKGLQRLQQRVEDQGRTIGELSDTLTQGFDRLTELVTPQTPLTDAATGLEQDTPAQNAEATPSINEIVKAIDPFDESSLADGLTQVAKVAEGNASKAVQGQLQELQDTMAEIQEAAVTAPQREEANERAIQEWVDENELSRDDFDRLIDQAILVTADSGDVDPEMDPQTYQDQVTGAMRLLTQQEKAATSAAGNRKPAPARTTPADTAGTKIVQDGARTTQIPKSSLNMHDELPIDAMDCDASDVWED